MEAIHQEQVLEFCNMCGCDFDIASDYLRCCDWSMESAISLFFENSGGAPLNVPQPEVPSEEKKEMNIPPICEHCQGNIQPLSSTTLVYKEECVHCDITWNDKQGINICLWCYLGFCQHHTKIHTEKTSHSLYLRIYRHPKQIEGEHCSKLTKLAIGLEGGFNETPTEYETHCEVYCEHCNHAYKVEGVYEELAEKILLRSSGEKEKELFQWEEETLKPCPHCDQYKLPSPCPVVSTVDIKCTDCDLSRNLWLCLECGEYHCGRKQWDMNAPPGNGHALEHFQKTGHSLVVKVASLQENHADVHCYSCDEDPGYNYGDILFPSIMEVLTKFGVLRNGKVVGLTADQQEKTIMEMNLIANQEFSFSMNDANGNAYEPYRGEGSCGLENLGNSCYMNSVLQILMQMPEVVSLLSQKTHFMECTVANPTNCLQCQMNKFINAYQKHVENHVVAPRMLKQVIGQMARDFNNNKQQDCYEFFTVLIDLLNQYTGNQLQSLFSIKSHYLMECQNCHHQDVSPSDEENCIIVQIPSRTDVTSYNISDLIRDSQDVDYIERDCPYCQTRTIWSRMSVIEQFPRYLCIRVNRFIIDKNTHTILKDTTSVIPEDSIQLSPSKDTTTECSQEYHCLGGCLHRGNKADFGHYVAVYKTKDQDEWILCNDSEVVIAPDAPVSECYLLFYKQR